MSATIIGMEDRDVVWKEIGLGAPARRALVNAKILKVSDLGKFTRVQVESLHGMGPSSMPKLDKAMKSAGVKFLT
ncbi:MAG: hypothetical protein K9F93_03595 [Candidatus Nanopelagicales bacterium]|nr:hypothetical protein [Candidatus Nanopelagicales bacterium]